MSNRCSATTRAGNPCRAHPVRGTDPPLCAAPGGAGRSPGAPLDNQNARTHGAYSKKRRLGPEPTDIPDKIEEVIRDLAVKHARLSQIINQNIDTADLNTLARLFSLHAQTASRLGRLLRDRRVLLGEDPDSLPAVIARALEELSEELCPPLGPALDSATPTQDSRP